MAADLTAQIDCTPHDCAGLFVHILPYHKKCGMCVIGLQCIQDRIGILSRPVIKGQCHHRSGRVDAGAFVNKRSAESGGSGCGGGHRCCCGTGGCGGLCCDSSCICRRCCCHDRFFGMHGIGFRRTDLSAGTAQNKQGCDCGTLQNMLSFFHDAPPLSVTQICFAPSLFSEQTAAENDLYHFDPCRITPAHRLPAGFL